LQGSEGGEWVGMVPLGRTARHLSPRLFKGCALKCWSNANAAPAPPPPCPGNINQLVLKLSTYCAELHRHGGVIAGFVNPKGAKFDYFYDSAL